MWSWFDFKETYQNHWLFLSQIFSYLCLTWLVISYYPDMLWLNILKCLTQSRKISLSLNKSESDKPKKKKDNAQIYYVTASTRTKRSDKFSLDVWIFPIQSHQNSYVQFGRHERSLTVNIILCSRFFANLSHFPCVTQ